MEESEIEDIEELDTVITELEISKGKGNIILCVVNSPLYRDRIIQTLNGRFSSKVINVNNGEQIISILKNEELDTAEILIWTMPEEATEDVINTLNNFRELFYEKKIPSVIFYNQGFSEQVITKAPDFWRYRGNYYEFKEEEMGLAFNALEALSSPLTYKNKEDLLRRKRINEYLLENIRDKKEKVGVLYQLGLISNYLGELDKALRFFVNTLELSEELGLKEGIALALNNMGIVYRIQGETEKALEHFEKALKIHEEIGYNRGVASTLGNIGNVYGMRGEMEKALEHFEKALEIEEEIRDKQGIASTLGNIGNVYQIQRKLKKALEQYQKALEIEEEIGNKKGIATDLGNMGNVYKIQGETEKALQHYEKALELKEEIGDKQGIANQLGNMGLIYQIQGDMKKALEHCEKALEIFRKIGNKSNEAQTLINIGFIFIKKGDKKTALDYYLEAQDIASDYVPYLLKEINERINGLLASQ